MVCGLLHASFWTIYWNLAHLQANQFIFLLNIIAPFRNGRLQKNITMQTHLSISTHNNITSKEIIKTLHQIITYTMQRIN